MLHWPSKHNDLPFVKIRHNGMTVSEYVTEDWMGTGIGKVVWIRGDLQARLVDGPRVPISPCYNPFFHADFVPEKKGEPLPGLARDLARRRVQDKFDEYWADPAKFQDQLVSPS